MRKYILGSEKFREAVKMCLVSSLILTYFIYSGIDSFYDILFPMSFIVLIFKYFLTD